MRNPRAPPIIKSSLIVSPFHANQSLSWFNNRILIGITSIVNTMAKKKKTGLWSKQSVYEKADGTTVIMDSSWEHICATKLDEAGIRWERSLDLILEYRTVRNRKRKYIPDFYLPDHDIYLEVKGYWTDAARHKMIDVQQRNPVRILVLESMPEVLSVERLIKDFMSKVIN